MTKYKSFLVFALFVLFLTPNILQVFRGAEHFPFSNNPMFGHIVTNTDSLATISFLLEDEKSNVVQMNFDDIGLWEVRFKRFYFSNVYGSSEPNSPQRNVSPTSDDFVRNNTLFFSKLDAILEHRGIPFKKIHVVLDEISEKDQLLERKGIGYFDAETKRFVLI